MIVYEDYVKLAEYYGLGRDTSDRVYSSIMGLKGLKTVYCTGLKPLNPPSLPFPENVKPLDVEKYAKRIKAYISILLSCRDFAESVSKVYGGPEAFYIAHLSWIASTRLSGALALRIESVPEGVFKTMTLDLKGVEINMFNTFNGARFLLGPLRAGAEQSQAYRDILNALAKLNVNIDEVEASLSDVNYPRVGDELIEWVVREKALIALATRRTAKRKSKWITVRAREDIEAAVTSIANGVSRLFGPYRVSKARRSLWSPSGDVKVRGYILCEAARKAADISGLYPYLLLSARPLSYIEYAWRPSKCVQSGFKWALESIVLGYASGGISEGQALEAIFKTVGAAVKGHVEAPEEALNSYATIVLKLLNLIHARLSTP
ncbi:MAG: hypothetical protein P3X22_004510 [Thermoprotei archaeon]|nr:hypothetical protein [Thermoprotei archaeon]